MSMERDIAWEANSLIFKTVLIPLEYLPELKSTGYLSITPDDEIRPLQVTT